MGGDVIYLLDAFFAVPENRYETLVRANLDALTWGEQMGTLSANCNSEDVLHCVFACPLCGRVAASESGKGELISVSGKCVCEL